MPIVENITTRGQQEYGRIFKPRADSRRFRSHWAIVEGRDRGAFDDARDLQENGLPIGTSGASLKFEPYRDSEGFHDVSYAGMKLREFVVPIAEAQEKERREALESTENCKNFLDAEQMRERVGENGLLTMRGELSSSVQSGIPHQADPERGAPIKSSTQGWTPERRARQEATLAAKKAATANKPTTTS